MNVDQLALLSYNNIRKGEYDDARSTDEYTRGKFRHMQTHLINWIANLDGNHRKKLAEAINNNPTNE